MNLDKSKKPDPEKMAILRSLPVEIKQQLTGEEIDAFLHEDQWPDSWDEKLKDFLVNHIDSTES